VLGTIIGVPLGNVAMTAVPQRTALSHAFGALCVTLVGSAEFYLRTPDISRFMMAVLSLEVILGGLDRNRQLDGCRQAAGDPAAAPVDLQGPEPGQLPVARRARWRLP
jgi:hypothetical protein